MHEFSIAQALLDIASREAAGAGASRVTRLTCRIGVLRQVETTLLHEAFEITREGTCCRDAELEIQKTYMHVVCPRCDRRFSVRDWRWQCPACNVEGRNPTGGDELELVSIDVEFNHANPSAHECVSAE